MKYASLEDESGVPITQWNKSSCCYEFIYAESSCRKCYGRGYIGKSRGCRNCHGKGHLEKNGQECQRCKGTGDGQSINEGFRSFCRCLKFESQLDAMKEMKEQYAREIRGSARA